MYMYVCNPRMGCLEYTDLRLLLCKKDNLLSNETPLVIRHTDDRKILGSKSTPTSSASKLGQVH